MTQPSVLIVDDSPAVRAGLRRILEAGGCRVVGEAGDGAAGASAFEHLRPDFVTLDLEMQPVDGFTALRRIRALDPAAAVILITSAYKRSFVLDALSLGAAYVLRKPPQSEKLLEAVRRVLARRAGRGGTSNTGAES